MEQLRANLMSKETELLRMLGEYDLKETTLQSKSKENEMLKLKLKLEAAKAAEWEDVMKLGIVMEEANRSNHNLMSVTEKLEVAHAAN
ncbi:hypothetical protein RIF29_27705 [Crotalaria pallida]|uniref:Uncharacterized protein n=1 Tax=Crotalaria pallida TaxID=3830 RepID=A0AAN9EQ88_CROPI